MQKNEIETIVLNKVLLALQKRLDVIVFIVTRGSSVLSLVLSSSFVALFEKIHISV